MVASVVATVGGAAPAGAHTLNGSASPTNYRSQVVSVVSVVPAGPGIRVRVRDLGRWLELVNHTPDDVVVR